MEASGLSGFSAETVSKFPKISHASRRHSRDGPSMRSIAAIEPMAWDLPHSTACKFTRGIGDMVELTAKCNDNRTVRSIALNPCRHEERDLADPSDLTDLSCKRPLRRRDAIVFLTPTRPKTGIGHTDRRGNRLDRASRIDFLLLKARELNDFARSIPANGSKICLHCSTTQQIHDSVPIRFL
jgi:hypothetical protein